MGIIRDSMDRWHKELFGKVSNSMENLAMLETFDKEKAKGLMEEYERLVTKTCNNKSLLDDEKKNWFDIITQNYEPSLSKLISRYSTE